MKPSGATVFCRYAFMPNRLGYCGDDDNRSLFEYGASGVVDNGLREMAQTFEGAYPYLRLIAGRNEIPDPLAFPVVEAYWLGNDLLDRIDMASLYDSLKERFAARTTPSDWHWLAGKAGAGSRPHHSFHVLEIFPRVGLMRDGAAERVVETMGHCIIRWGRVTGVLGAELMVEAPRLAMTEGKLVLSELQPEHVTCTYDGRGFLEGIEPGDWVSLHWGWACEKLSTAQRSNLEHYTRCNLKLANETI